MKCDDCYKHDHCEGAVDGMSPCFWGFAPLGVMAIQQERREYTKAEKRQMLMEWLTKMAVCVSVGVVGSLLIHLAGWATGCGAWHLWRLLWLS